MDRSFRSRQPLVPSTDIASRKIGQDRAVTAQLVMKIVWSVWWILWLGMSLMSLGLWSAITNVARL
jgi:hypothetical protein